MTPFEQHMRKYHPNSITARLSREVEELRDIGKLHSAIKKNEEQILKILRENDDND